MEQKTIAMLKEKYFYFEGGCLKKPMTDEEYLALVEQEYKEKNIYKRALSKLGLDAEQVKEIPPKEFRDFVYKDAVLGPSGLFSNKYQVSWLFFSDTELYIYSCIFDMLSKDAKESCEEYFYKDITSISSVEDTIETVQEVKSGCMLFGNKEIRGTKEFSSLKIIVPGDQLLLAMKNSPEIERNIQAMKQKLREKKN